MIYSLGLFSDVGNAIVQALRSFGGMIAASIYELIVYVYNIFTLLARAEILDNDLVNAIYERVGLILGLFMLFKLTFTLIQSLIDPSKISDKNKGFAAIIQRSIIAIVLLGITPAIFKEAYKLQNLIIGSNSASTNIIYKLIVGNTTGISADSFGRTLASKMFFKFYSDNESPSYDNGLAAYEEELPERYRQENYETLKEKIESGEENFYFAISPLSFRNNGEYAIEFDFLFIMIVGAAILYILFIYCFQVATRVFQLAFLQLIAPIPILSYISNPDGFFKKWLNKCSSTYLDLFIRVSIIYFVVYLSTYVFEQLGDTSSILMQSLGEIGGVTLTWVTIFLIIGLLLFAKKVPELLKELFPNLGGSGLSMGLGFKKNVLEPAMSSPLATPFGYVGKKTLGYIDRKKHNLPKPRNKMQQWLDNAMPGRAAEIKNRNEGRKEVAEINKKWNKGADIARELILKHRFGPHGTANSWEKAFDGTTRANYQYVFKHEEFITSKMNLDSAKNLLNSLRDGLTQVQSGGVYTDSNGTVYTINGGNYTDASGTTHYGTKSLSDLSKKYNSQTSTVSGLESVHNSIRKQYSDDAEREDVFKFIKNNAANPADPTNTHSSAGI